MRIVPRRKQAWPFAISNIVDHAKSYSRSHDAVVRVYDEAGNVIETHEHIGDFREFSSKNNGNRDTVRIRFIRDGMTSLSVEAILGFEV